MKILSLSLLFFFLTTNAYAYVDPGSMAWIFQAFIALLGGVLVFFKSIVRNIKVMISNIKNSLKKKKNGQ